MSRRRICCFSSRMVNKEVLQDKPQKRVKPILKTLTDLIIERTQKIPVRFGETMQESYVLCL